MGVQGGNDLVDLTSDYGKFESVVGAIIAVIIALLLIIIGATKFKHTRGATGLGFMGLGTAIGVAGAFSSAGAVPQRHGVTSKHSPMLLVMWRPPPFARPGGTLPRTWGAGAGDQNTESGLRVASGTR